MFVAIALAAGMPKARRAGTVMREVAPVTTLITLVTKKIRLRAAKPRGFMLISEPDSHRIVGLSASQAG
jgi:hypothetical protein